MILPLTNSNYPTIFYDLGFDGFLMLALDPPKAEESPSPPPLFDPDGFEGYTTDLAAALIFNFKIMTSLFKNEIIT